MAHLQSALDLTLPTDLRQLLIKWLDDMFVSLPNEDDLMEDILALFNYCTTRNIKFHPFNVLLFAKEARWCGRIISHDGMKLDPCRVQGLLGMKPPTTGSEMHQFICALQWVKNGIPTFSALVALLHEFMERVYEQAGKQTKRAVANLQTNNLGWGDTEQKKFEDCKSGLAFQVTLLTAIRPNGWASIPMHPTTSDLESSHKPRFWIYPNRTLSKVTTHSHFSLAGLIQHNTAGPL